MSLFSLSFLGLGTLLFSPFVQQARSLVANLQKPSLASLQGVTGRESICRVRSPPISRSNRAWSTPG